MQKFELKRIAEICPDTGESLGGALARFATSEEERFRANPNPKVSYWAHTVAQVLYLAAEAFEQASSASIGHNRSARYDEAANGYRRRAEALEAQAEQERSDDEAEALMKCFRQGYAGEDIKRLSFDRREAALIGSWFYLNKLPIPNRINGVRPYKTGHFLVNNQTFRVAYPEGKVTGATVELVD